MRSRLEKAPASGTERYPGPIKSPDDLPGALEVLGVLDNYEIVNEEANDKIVDLVLSQDRIDDIHNSYSADIIFRGMPPRDIFTLLQGKSVAIKPYDYGSKKSEEDDIQNASYSYRNAISHGYDRALEHDILTAVAFETHAPGITIKKTGLRMVEQFGKEAEEGMLPENRDLDVSVAGTLHPSDVELVIIRFPRKYGFRKTFLRPKQKGPRYAETDRP